VEAAARHHPHRSPLENTLRVLPLSGSSSLPSRWRTSLTAAPLAPLPLVSRAPSEDRAGPSRLFPHGQNQSVLGCKRCLPCSTLPLTPLPVTTQPRGAAGHLASPPASRLRGRRCCHEALVSHYCCPVPAAPRTVPVLPGPLAERPSMAPPPSRTLSRGLKTIPKLKGLS